MYCFKRVIFTIDNALSVVNNTFLKKNFRLKMAPGGRAGNMQLSDIIENTF
jgi:hypothetical protein